MIKAVIFDMDGVITDTQPLHNKTNAEVLQFYGIPLTEEDLSKFAGIPNKKIFPDLFKKYNIKSDPNKAVLEKWRLITKRTKKVRPISGVLNFIKNLHGNNFKLALASSSTENFINHILNSLKIKHFFTIIINGDEIKKGKPNPDIFLKAAEKLNINPANCLVLEDTPSGVKAAKSAGMKCIAITTSQKREQLKQADKIIDNFSELTISELNSL